MSDQQETVALPDDYFVKSVFQAYHSPQQALFREFLQNSVDAGATKVDFMITEEGISVEDDGCGMTEEIIRPALLTLNGSYKRAGSIGGFGSAKEILLFGQECYEIHTLDVWVCGSKLRYTLRRIAPRIGTKIKINLHPNYKFSVENFTRLAEEYFKLCDTAATITLNGRLMPKLKIERIGKELPWGRVLIKQLRGVTTQDAIIRSKGVMMFKRYVGTSKKLVVVEVDKPSTDLLTSNRDSFNHVGYRDFDNTMIELAIDKESFGSRRGEKKVIKGIENYYVLLKSNRKRIEKLLEVIRSHRSNEVATQMGMRVDNLLQQSGASNLNNVIADTIAGFERSGNYDAANQIKDILSPNEEEKKRLPVDFVINYGAYDPETLPSYYHPNTMGQRMQLLAQHWREAVRACLDLAKDDERILFRIGWTLEEDFKATCQQDEKDNQYTILLNPTLPIWKQGVREYMPTMIALAAHEAIHATGEKYHDETFAKLYTELVAKVLAKKDLLKKVRLAVQPEADASDAE